MNDEEAIEFIAELLGPAYSPQNFGPLFQGVVEVVKAAYADGWKDAVEVGNER